MCLVADLEIVSNVHLNAYDAIIYYSILKGSSGQANVNDVILDDDVIVATANYAY